jgi:hypothetical protein
MKSLSRGLVCAVVAACGGGDSGSGVDDDKSLAETTVDEREQLCEWYVDTYVEADLIRFGCYAAAIEFSSGDLQACEELAQQCLDMETEEELDQELRDQLDCSVDDPVTPPGCASELTVGAFEDCAVGLLDHLEDFAADISCDNTMDELTRANDIREVPACAEMVEACPDLSGP